MYVQLGSEMKTTERHISYQLNPEHLNKLLIILPYGLLHDYMHSAPVRPYKFII